MDEIHCTKTPIVSVLLDDFYSSEKISKKKLKNKHFIFFNYRGLALA
jgi:hypothetical protein